MIIPIASISLIPFILSWGFDAFNTGRKEFMHLFIYVFILGIIIHELLHGITWAFFTKNGFRSIKFGINGLTPYCHCKEPLKVRHYKIGGAMPLIIMGIIPLIAGLILGNGLFLWLGTFFTWAASGDIFSLFMLRKMDNKMMIYDHPDELGFYVEL